MNEIANQNTTLGLISGADLEQVSAQLQAIDNFQVVVQKTLKVDQDYGTIPGTNKPTLLKPGAEKILMLMGLTSEYEIVDKVEEYDKGFFAYTVKSKLFKNGQLITEGFGSANTKETRYQLKEWSDEENKKVWNGKFQDAYTLVNTVLKMAKKRAQVDAALTIGSLSNIFTQDIEDMRELLDKEQTETMDSGNASDYKITFGKHKGSTLGEVLSKDRSYLEWLSSNAKQESMRRAATIILEGGTTEQTQTEVPIELLTSEQKSKIMGLAELLGGAHNMSADEVIAGCRVNNLDSISEADAVKLYNLLDKKFNDTLAKEAEILKAQDVDIPDSELPFDME